VAGYSLLTASLSPNNAFFFVSLKHWSERGGDGLHVNDLIQKINGQLALSIPGAIAFAFGPPAIPGLGTGSGFSMMLQDRGGNTPAYLAGQADGFIEAARERPEIGTINSVFRANVPQIFAEVNTDMVLKLGVSPADVNTALGSFLGGAYVNDFNRFGRLYKVYVQAERISVTSLCVAPAAKWCRYRPWSIHHLHRALNIPTVLTCSARPRYRVHRHRVTAPTRRWMRWKRSQSNTCPKTCPIRGTR
jgi:multidrug efflux pump subunit AcrB